MNPAVVIPAVAWSTISTTAFMVAQDVQNGVEPSTYTNLTVWGLGAAVIGALWKGWRSDQQEAAAARRLDDERTQAELVRLRRRNDQLVARLAELGLKIPPHEENDDG